MFTKHARWITACICPLFAGCVLAPADLDEERLKLAASGAPYAAEAALRELPALSSTPSWTELLERAFLANGELEAAWHEWRGAMARVTADSTWPSSNVEVGVERMFSSETSSAWDRTSIGFGFDPDTMLELPFKTELMGSIAFAEARAAGERFRAAKNALRRQFIESWVELARLEEEIALQEEVLALQRSASSAAERAAMIGANSMSLVRTRIEIAALESEIVALKSTAERQASLLRGIANVPRDVAITAKGSWPMRRVPALGDDEIISLAALSNPRLAELARSVEGRADALELARAAWWPNISPRAGFTGSVSQFIGASLSLPVAVPRVRAEIEESEAGLARAQALVRQRASDVNAALTAELLALREAERAHAFLADTLVPLANELSSLARNGYAGGTVTQMEWLDTLRTVIEARKALLGARAARETSLARLEEWIGFDLEMTSKSPEVSDAR